MWLYNNDYGNRFNEIAESLKGVIEEKRADLCIVDNLMALDLASYDVDKYEAQTKFVWELKEIAESLNVHVIFVAHPRKAQGFLRLDDVSGSANISNIVDNAFIIHRNNADFQRLTKQMFAWKSEHDAYSGTNVIEICKDRENGNQDVFIPLWYEPETKRLKNDPYENKVYSWKKPEKAADDASEWIDTSNDGDAIPF
jgi:RecA-family ATPase